MKESLPLELNIFKPEHLALQINFPLKTIYKILESKEKKVRNFKFIQHKQDGTLKERDIYSPCKDYKLLLRKINSNLLNKAKLPEGICGAVVGKSLIDMVKKHCGKEAFFQIDMKDFFPNINNKRIINFFLKSNCSDEVAKILTDLVIYKDFLPQGFPTSPMIANLIAYKLDKEQLNLCKKFSIYRTRWIDDIVFSGRINSLEQTIPKLITSVNKNNFDLNIIKSKVKRRKQKPEIVGLSVNKHNPYIPERIIEKVEEYIFVARKNGYKKLKELYPDEFRKKDVENSLIGKIRYIKTFNPLIADNLIDSLSSKVQSLSAKNFPSYQSILSMDVREIYERDP